MSWIATEERPRPADGAAQVEEVLLLCQTGSLTEAQTLWEAWGPKAVALAGGGSRRLVLHGHVTAASLRLLGPLARDLSLVCATADTQLGAEPLRELLRTAPPNHRWDRWVVDARGTVHDFDFRLRALCALAAYTPHRIHQLLVRAPRAEADDLVDRMRRALPASQVQCVHATQ